MKGKIEAAKKKISDQYLEIETTEKKERNAKKHEAQNEAEEFFNSKEGVLYLNNATTAVMESTEFIKEHIDVSHDKKERKAPLQVKKEAAAIAKSKYTTDLYLKKVQEAAEKFYKFKEELKQRIAFEEENNMLSMRRPLVLGADRDSGEGAGSAASGFVGHLSCFSLYHSCLSSDRVRAHYLAATNDKTLNASRYVSILHFS
jgi:hypothetical protein